MVSSTLALFDGALFPSIERARPVRGFLSRACPDRHRWPWRGSGRVVPPNRV